MLIWLIILDLFWSGAAFVYDTSKLITISPFLWLFVAVCPIFPLLLALVLLKLYLKKPPNQFLLAFAAIPSALYGLLSLMFYPLAMYYQGFSWNGLGQIFWVMFYGLQGFWLLKKIRLDQTVFKLVFALITTKILVFEFYLESFGYFDFSNIPKSNLLMIMAGAAVLLALFWTKKARRGTAGQS